MPESGGGGGAKPGGGPVEVEGRLGQAIPLPTGVEHTIKIGKAPREVRLCLLDEDGVPHAGKRYKLVVEGQTFEGQVGDDGVVRHEIPHSAETGTLEAWLDDDAPDEATTWELALDALAPLSDLAGIQARLKNLGFYDGEADGSLSDAFKRALFEVQEHLGYDEPTGELDEETRAAIARLHVEG